MGQGSDMDTKVVKYFVMTSPTGYVNSYSGIAQRSNAQIVFDADRPLGQYSLKLQLIQDLAADREILTSYGSKHPVGEPKKRPKAPKSVAKGNEGGG